MLSLTFKSCYHFVFKLCNHLFSNHVITSFPNHVITCFQIMLSLCFQVMLSFRFQIMLSPVFKSCYHFVFKSCYHLFSNHFINCFRIFRQEVEKFQTQPWIIQRQTFKFETLSQTVTRQSGDESHTCDFPRDVCDINENTSGSILDWLVSFKV